MTLLRQDQNNNGGSSQAADSEAPTERTPLIPGKQDSQSSLAHEFRWLVRNSMPIVGTYLLEISLQLASIFTLGHLGSVQLAASALAAMFANVTAWSVTFGAATALDTLCSQAWTGSPDKTLVGVHLQRALLVLGLLFVPIAVIWWNAAQILLALDQEPELAHYAGLFLRTLLFGVPAFITFEGLKKYLQAQGIMKASTYVLMIASPVNFVLNYVLVYCEPFRLGFIGAPLATMLSYWLMLFMLIGYMWYTKNGIEAWGGWSRRALDGWWEFLRLAIPGILMVCSEWWAFEMSALAASYLGTIDLAAQSILLTSATATNTFPFGISVAATNRVGNALGEGLGQKARFASVVALFLAIVVGAATSTFYMVTRSYFGYLFTTDADVVHQVAVILPFCALFQIADGINGVCSGVIRGLGRQKVAAWVNLFSYYVVALPLGYYLTFIAGWGLTGVWVGLSVALFLGAIGDGLFVSMVDWSSEASRVSSHFKKDDD